MGDQFKTEMSELTMSRAKQLKETYGGEIIPEGHGTFTWKFESEDVSAETVSAILAESLAGVRSRL